jgi:hypothetical protein
MKKIFSTSLILLIFLFTNNTFSFYIWQDFDNPNFPPAGWTLVTTNAFNWDWSIMGTAYGTGYGSCKGNSNDASAGLTFDLISPQFTAAVTGDSLVFDEAYATYSGINDQLKIWYSTDGGNNWTQLVLLNGGASGELVTAPATGLAFVPTSSQWATKRYSLPAGTNKLKFTCISACGNNMYLDNIRIGTRYTADAGAVGFKRFLKAMTPASIDTPKVYVRNFGTNTQTIPVTLTITPGTYSQTQTAASVAPGSSFLLTFPPFTVPASGNVTMKAYSTLSGDQNISNDTIYNYYVSTNNPRNVLIEYCTGTWCQWCPCAKVRILDLENFYPNTVVLAYHGNSTSADPYKDFNGNDIINLLSLSYYPTGTIDRTRIPNDYCGYSSFVETSFMRYLNSPVAPVKIDVVSQSYNSGTKQLNITLNATALSTLSGQYKINYVITEDNLVYTQTGNTYCTGTSSYVHKWVVRNMVNNASGENLNTGGTWTSGQVISKSFSTTINSAWVENNCKIKIFVYKDGSPLNSNAEIQQSIERDITLTGINEPNVTPAKFELNQNYPNPFNPVTNVKFGVPKNGHYTFRIYDVTGKLVDTYLDGTINAGYYNAEITSTNLSSGVYFYTLQGEGFTDTKKMVLLK